MKQDKDKSGRMPTKKQTIIIGGILLALVAVIIIGLFFATQPERSVASFCRVAKEEKSVLTGDVNYEKRLESYKKLEAVSPDDIRPDISTIRKGYEEIVKNPSSTLSTGLGMSGAENRRTTYIDTNCKNF